MIINGRPEKEMPAFPKANVADLTAFLHFRAFEALNSAHVPHDYPVEKLLTGNAGAGKVFFDETAAPATRPRATCKLLRRSTAPSTCNRDFFTLRRARAPEPVEGQPYGDDHAASQARRCKGPLLTMTSSQSR